ncbi:BGN_3a_G0047390.mRNA.1.CDS.1 [Saccharomyces cerevisiae]|nr:BGN_3a_G0047390.mRNA.1.CDS.1 [Saccharomyces cerevisiae]CAI7320953.1 BGN_3a_G0047390.mRNA.1.CDS.1 [Saccharomyces cerevisiae]
MIKDLSSTTLHKTATRASKYATSYSYQFHHVLKKIQFNILEKLELHHGQNDVIDDQWLVHWFYLFHVGGKCSWITK